MAGFGTKSPAGSGDGVGAGGELTSAEELWVQSNSGLTSTDEAIVRFDGTGGDFQNSGITIDDTNNLLLVNSDGGALGSATKMWSDLFLASGAVINFNNGDVTITHGADLLTFAGGTIALGVATATSINGLTLTSSTGTLTITNAKTLTVSNTITLAGTDAQTYTFPTTSATIARTDAANTFTGIQTFSTPIAVGSVATMTATVGGGVPTPPNNTTTFLRGDGTFAAPAGGSGTDMFSATVWTVSIPLTLETGSTGVAGSASIGATAGALLFTTGATNDSIASGEFMTGASPALVNFAKNVSVRHITTGLTTQAGGSGSVHQLYSGSSPAPGSLASNTARHIGFRLAAAVINASNSDGTTETATDISSGLTANQLNIWDAIFLTGTNCKFYVNGTLKATHTTNLPASTGFGAVFLAISNGTSGASCVLRAQAAVFQQGI